MAIYSEEEKLEIQNLYKQELNTVQIAKLLGRSQTGIESFLKRNLLFQKKNHRHKIPHCEDPKIISLYTEENLTMDEIGKIYGVCDASIRRILIKNNIDTTITEKYSKIKDLSAFKEIDSELKAWLLGFILADGNIHVPQKRPNSQVFQIEIQERDVEILKHLCHLLDTPETVIKTYYREGKNPMVRINFYSNTLCNDLRTHGIFPRKSLTATLPVIDDDLQRHLVRGLFDGDGTITKYKIELFGNEYICDAIHSIFLDLGVEKDSIKRYFTSCHRIGVYKKSEREKILKYLYQDSNYSLKRKAIYSPY